MQKMKEAQTSSKLQIVEYIHQLKLTGLSWEEIFEKTNDKYFITSRSPDSLRKFYAYHKTIIEKVVDNTSEKLILTQDYPKAYEHLSKLLGKNRIVKTERSLSKNILS
jgi:type IV secretory pathway TraG/TraD family ATPase VirD4